MKKLLLKLLGIICVTLGALGIILPVLPTTPFLLLASWAFVKSSDKLYTWLMEHPVFGIYIKSYILYKGVSKSHKIIALTTLWISIGISMYIIKKTYLIIMLFVIASLVTIHLLKLKTLTKEEMEEIDKMRSSSSNKS